MCIENARIGTIQAAMQTRIRSFWKPEHVVMRAEATEYVVMRAEEPVDVR